MTDECVAEIAYFDHAATTPMCDEAVAAMLPYFRDRFANPSGVYGVSRSVRRALDDARDELGELVGCRGEEIVFTSGGTESDNLAIFGAARRPGEKNETTNVVVSAGEHKAVLAPAHDLDARIVAIDERCQIDLEALRESLDENTSVVSVMAVNNEVGVVQPIAEVASVVRQFAPNALLHCDAVQAFPFLDAAALTSPCDLVTYSAHKFAGPKGIGALVVRGDGAKRLFPQHVGGSQERGVRPGTENVAGVIGMVAAARWWSGERAAITARVATLRDRLADGVLKSYPPARETAPRELRVAGNCHVRVPGVATEELLMALDQLGVCASAGSACASGALEPSHVLVAMGLSNKEAREAVRFSLGWTTTKDDVDRALQAIGVATRRLGRGDFLRD